MFYSHLQQLYLHVGFISIYSTVILCHFYSIYRSCISMSVLFPFTAVVFVCRFYSHLQQMNLYVSCIPIYSNFISMSVLFPLTTVIFLCRFCSHLQHCNSISVLFPFTNVSTTVATVFLFQSNCISMSVLFPFTAVVLLCRFYSHLQQIYFYVSSIPIFKY